MPDQNKSRTLTILIVIISVVVIVFALITLGNLFSSNLGVRSGVEVEDIRSVKSDPPFSLSLKLKDGQSISSRSTVANSSSNFADNGRSLSSSNSSSSSSAASYDGEYNLQTGELVAQYTGGTTENYEILDCNVAEPFYCKAGVKLTFNLGGSEAIQIGDKYKMSGNIVDTADGLSLSDMTITAIE